SVVSSQQTVTVTARSVLDSTRSGSATVTLVTAPVTGNMLTLSPQLRGPNVMGTTQTMVATLKDSKGAPLAGASVNFQVAGPNPASGTATTNAAGTATFTYTGANRGTDTVQASSGAVVSNTANISWLQPIKAISTSAVFGQFFTSNLPNVGDCCYYFNT